MNIRKIIINREAQHGTIDREVKSNRILLSLVNKALKRGHAKLIVDNETVLMYEIQEP